MKRLLLSSALLVAVAGIAMAQAPVQIIPAPGRFPVVVAFNRATGQTAAVASVVAYTPGADGTFEVSGNVNCTTATTYAFALQVTYTDESNTGRTVSLPVTTPAGTLAPGNTSTIVNTTAGPYLGLPTHIRVKGGTAITILTTGTFTTVTYNVEGVIKQVQ